MQNSVSMRTVLCHTNWLLQFGFLLHCYENNSNTMWESAGVQEM